MNHVIIGTAGHIDHGKTSLIKALTNIDTDRLKEEKLRGISIDLGFAYFDLPGGRRAGIVDVPGHEKFVKKMIAGAGGIDIVIMVIAADEGVMPQTIEHLNILSFLEIKKGIIAVTKTDLVDQEWIELVIEDIKEHVKGTFLENAPIVPVSSKTRQGLDELVKTIDELTQQVKPKDLTSPFRLPIDRVFTLTGFGTIVTGTLLSGRIRKDDLCEILPRGLTARVRNIQVHGKDVMAAEAGQRTAINLTGVKTEEIFRGDVLSKPGYLKPTKIIDARLKLLKEAQNSIKHMDPIRISTGAKEVLGRVRLLDSKLIKPGREGLVQFLLEEPIAVLYKDRYVARSYSPVTTIGGGEVLNPNPERKKPFNKKVIEDLQIRATYPLKDVLEHVIKLKSRNFPDTSKVIEGFGMTAKCRQNIELLKNEGKVIEIPLAQREVVVHREYYKQVVNSILNTLKEYHEKNPLEKGMVQEELREKQGLPSHVFDYFISKLVKNKEIKVDGHIVSLQDFRVVFNEEQKRIKQAIEKGFLKGGFKPPKLEDVLNNNNIDEKQGIKVFKALIQQGELIKITEDVVFHKSCYEKGKEVLISYLKHNKSITLAEFRDLLGTSRKFALPLLEHFDEIKVTKRIEDRRILYKSGSSPF